MMASVILKNGTSILSQEQLQSIVLSALQAAQEADFPEGFGYQAYTETCIAVGYWDDNGTDLFFRDVSEWRIPDGCCAEVRRVRHADGYGGKFNTVVTVGDDGEEEEDWQHTYCDPPDSPCVFVCERCFYYLEKWLDLGERGPLPNRRIGFSSESEPLSLAGELYEIVNIHSGASRGVSSPKSLS